MLFSKIYEGSTYPTIFIHGFLGSHKDAKSLIHNSFISWHAIDLPGHGKTKQEAAFKDLTTYLDNLSSSFHLVGYSLGGRVAQKLASHINCKSLSLLSSHTIFNDQEYLARIEFEKNLLQNLIIQPLDEFLITFYNSPIFASLRHNRSLFEKYIKARLSQDKDDLIFGLNELAMTNIVSDLPNCPILGLYGEFDLKYQKIYTLLPEKVSVVSIDHAGHTIHLENPKSCLKALEKFIGTVEHDMENMRQLSRH